MTPSAAHELSGFEVVSFGVLHDAIGGARTLCVIVWSRVVSCAALRPWINTLRSGTFLGHVAVGEVASGDPVVEFTGVVACQAAYTHWGFGEGVAIGDTSCPVVRKRAYWIYGSTVLIELSGTFSSSSSRCALARRRSVL